MTLNPSAVAGMGTKLVDSYIIRIYRQEKKNPRMIVGTVEEVGLEGRKPFNSYDGLWEILHERQEATRRRRSVEERK